MDSRTIKFTKLLPQLQLTDLCGFAKGLGVPLIDVFGIKNSGKPPSKEKIIDFEVEVSAAFSKLTSKKQKDYLKVAKLVAAENKAEGLETIDQFIRRETDDKEDIVEGDK